MGKLLTLSLAISIASMGQILAETEEMSWNQLVQTVKKLQETVKMHEGNYRAQQELTQQLQDELASLHDQTINEAGDTIEERVERLEELSKLKVLRSCHELFQHGIKTSGLYDIDPDGENIGRPPIQVYCNYTSGATLTVLSHDSEEPVEVEHGCDGPGCFTHSITYENPIDQIQALIQISDRCSQTIQIDCYSAPLANGEVEFGWWLDKNGDRQYYFDGNHVGEHVCRCSEDNSCSGSGSVVNTCNCDANDPTWAVDSGVITTKEILPITGFAYGPLDFEPEQAVFTIGKLKCGGQRQENNEEVTCNSLKRSGIMDSSIQVLKRGPYPEVAFCDMASVNGYEGDMESFISYMDVNSLQGGVHFSAGKNSRADIVSPYDVKDYTLLWANYGNGFNMETGEFTAPVGGLYRFTMSTVGNDNPNGIFDVNAILRSDPGYNFEISQSVPDSGLHRISGTWDMNLKKDDVVFLQVQRGTIRIYSNVPLTFSGYLVNEIAE